MSKLEVNAVEPQCGTNLTLGASGDTIIIPSGATISNQGTAAGFGPTGAVSWNTTKITANPNPAVTGVGYFCDTTSAAFTVTLPATPAAGAVIGIADYANTFATNNITVGRNGSNIGGFAENAVLSTNGVSITFVYVDATQGWIVTDSGQRSDLDNVLYVAATGGTITTCGNYKIHSFTGPGTFTVTNAGNSVGSNSVEYLVVAGGGGGGTRSGGGGGAGGFRQNFPSPAIAGLPVSVQGYPITVGSGGAAAGPGGSCSGGIGNNSVFSTITSNGGGGGGGAVVQGGNGGSGAGNGNSFSGGGGTGNTPPVNPSQGNPGGSTTCSSSGSGGGGATAAGGNSTSYPTGGNGGNGTATSISGSPTTFSGGGGGGVTSGTSGTGGTGGGGAGGPTAGTPGTAGIANTGGGGGGGGGGAPPGANGLGAAGGSGIVIVRYKFQ
jgi:hypothetical protein